MIKKYLIEDIKGILYSKKEKINKKYVLIYKENMDFFKGVLSDNIDFKKASDLPIALTYINISNFTTDDIEILREYRDYLILIND